MIDTVRLDIPVVLPGVGDDQDECVRRMVVLLVARDGIERVHVVHEHASGPIEHEVGEHPAGVEQVGAALCLHYDPERVSLGQIESLAERAGASITERYDHRVIGFHDVASEDEGARLEEALRSVDGVTAAIVNYAGQLARVEIDTSRLQWPAVYDAMAAAGATPLRQPASVAESWYNRNRELAWSLTAGALTLIGWLTARAVNARSLVPIALYVVAYVFGARDNVGHLFKDLRRGHVHFNIDLLMVVAALGAAVLGEWVEGALLLFLFSLGHAMEHYALGRARNAITALAELSPQTATVRRDGTEQTVPLADVRIHELVVVKPAERISVDGTVREGTSAVNQAPITGESVPVEKATGDQVFAGTVNGDGALVIDVSAAVGDRTLDRVIKLVAEAGTQKAAAQQFTERFERVFVPVVLVADVLLIAVPPLLGIWPLADSFYRAMALLVAASPCALALGTPATVLAGIAQAARNGVLIKGGAHLESLGSIDVFALDKTGTVTMGTPEVTDVVPMAGADETTLLRSAASVEAQSQHPLAAAVLRSARSRHLDFPAARDAQSVTGRGIRATVDGATVSVGRLTLFAEASEEVPQAIRDAVTRLEGSGRTTMGVHRSGSQPGWLGVIGVADRPRERIRETLDALRSAGVKRIVMLTGDNRTVANAIGHTVGVDDVRAELMPEDKVDAIKELATHGRVAMVGDGVNDTPALAHATVGIAMGGAGTAAALETADVALMSDDLGRLPFAVELSRQARTIIRQNLVVSLTVIGVLAVATVAGFARIGPAVVAHEGSTLVVIANALRLFRHQPRPT